MAKIYDNRATSTKTITGVVESIAADRSEITIKTKQWDREAEKNNDVSIPIKVDELGADVSVGDSITAVAYKNPRINAYESLFTCTKSGSFDQDSISVIRGEVAYARFDEEKNADGTPKMSRPYTNSKDGKTVESHPKKAHFDIAIDASEPDPASSKDGVKNVRHIIRVYAMTRDGKTDTKNLDRVKNLFSNFDKDSNPCLVTVVTTPGQSFTTEKESNGKTYTNHYCNHMGYKSLDVEFLKVKEQTKNTPAPAKDKKEEEKAPFDNAPTQAGSGFEEVGPEEPEEVNADELWV